MIKILEIGTIAAARHLHTLRTGGLEDDRAGVTEVPAPAEMLLSCPDTPECQCVSHELKC